MKFIFALFLILHILPTYAQEVGRHIRYNAKTFLIAKNEKHLRKYKNGTALKIFYNDSGHISKAKGRLVVYNNKNIQLIPFGRKEIINISTGSIISVGLWKRSAKISVGVIAAFGIIVSTAVVLLPDVNESSDLASFLLIAVAVADGYFIAIGLPATLLSEWLSKRSAKRGYHFYVEYSTQS